MCQHRDVKEIEKQLNKHFKNVCDWSFDNRLRLYFGEDKAKSILFATKCKVKSARKLNIQYNINNLYNNCRLHNFGCILDEILSGEPTALKRLNKINGKLKFLYLKKKFLTPFLSIHILIMPALHGTITSIKNNNKKKKFHIIRVSSFP